MFHASTCITSVAPSQWRAFWALPRRNAPETAIPRWISWLQMLSGRKARSCAALQSHAIAHHLFAHYTDLFLPVLRLFPLALPMQSVMTSVTPVCFLRCTPALCRMSTAFRRIKPVLTCDTLFDAAIHAGRKPAIVSTCGDSISKIFLDRPMDYFLYDTVERKSSSRRRNSYARINTT